MSNEKAERKEILRALKHKQAEQFFNSLPVGREVFLRLFDYLDGELGKHGCDHSLRITKHFLMNEGISDISPIIAWLEGNGGSCDCEVLGNIEEKL